MLVVAEIMAAVGMISFSVYIFLRISRKIVEIVEAVDNHENAKFRINGFNFIFITGKYVDKTGDSASVTFVYALTLVAVVLGVIGILILMRFVPM